MRLTGTGEPISSISKAKTPGFSSVVQKSGAMYLSMVGVGRIIVSVGSGLGKDTTFLPILRSPRCWSDRRKAVSLRLVICPPGRRSAAAGAAAADASATTHPESGQARFPPLKLRSPSLAPATWAPRAQVTSALLPRAGETVAAGVVHRLARATLHWPTRGARLPDRRPAPARCKGKAVTVGRRQTLHSRPCGPFVPGFASVNRAGSSPPSLPREVQ